MSTTVTFSVGDANDGVRMSGEVNIISDMLLEGPHMFTVSLPSANTEYTIGDRNILYVTILDTADCKLFN